MGHGQTTNGQLLVALGAKWGPAIAIDHQYWRLLTPIFLHAGWLHIITNMLTLWFIGPLAEAAFGHRKFLGLYLFGGVVGNIMSYLFRTLDGVCRCFHCLVWVVWWFADVCQSISA